MNVINVLVNTISLLPYIQYFPYPKAKRLDEKNAVHISLEVPHFRTCQEGQYAAWYYFKSNFSAVRRRVFWGPPFSTEDDILRGNSLRRNFFILVRHF